LRETFEGATSKFTLLRCSVRDPDLRLNSFIEKALLPCLVSELKKANRVLARSVSGEVGLLRPDYAEST